MSEKDTVLKRRSQLSQTKQSLLERWIQGKGAKVLEEQAIPRRSAHETVPLSFAQQRLWFLEQLEPGNPFYNIASALDITGKLGVAMLQRSFNELIRRHEILRTVFAASDGEPIQIINDPAPLPLFCIDLSSLSDTRRMHEARQL